MVRKTRTEVDGDSPFLLPFEEIPKCIVPENGRSAFRSAEDGDSTYLQDAEPTAEREYFDSFILERTTKKLMVDGPSDLNHSGKFQLKLGQHVLLRPEENSLRPGVGKLIAVFRDKGEGDLRIRVRWYYRGEDLTEAPKEAVGEDEVFGTQHFDDTDAESIAGRCLMLAYRDWIFKAHAKQKSTALLTAKFNETLERDGRKEENNNKSDNSHANHWSTETGDDDARNSRRILRAKLREAMEQDNVLSQNEPIYTAGKQDKTVPEHVTDIVEEDGTGLKKVNNDKNNNSYAKHRSTEEGDGNARNSRCIQRAKLREAMDQDNLLPQNQLIDTAGKRGKTVTADVIDVDEEEEDTGLRDGDNEERISDGAPTDAARSLPGTPLQNAAENMDGTDLARDEDIMSTFRANYPESSLFYYCRRFYDPLSNTFLVSKHEDDNADPTEEIIALRTGRKRVDGYADDEYREERENDSSSDEDVNSDFSAEDLECSNGRPKRRRSGKRQKSVRKRERIPGVSQFSLPQDLGVPSKLPCRDSQKEHVQKFLLGAIRGAAIDGQGGSRCLYISGVPGTGKTATVREVIRDLLANRDAGSLPPFEVVEVNAMTLPDPNLVYAELYAALTGNRNVTPMHAAQLLEKRFSSDTGKADRKTKRAKTVSITKRHDSCTILILDEMDVLLARKQKVLYDMLEWPTRKDARMAVIGIANTMDLPERILPRIGSRLGLNRLSYPPYTSSQLQTILEMSLEETRVDFSAPAIQLCVKKIGSVSGDVRRALELCRRACEILLDGQDTPEDDDNDEAKKPMVKAEHMQAAIRDIAGGSRLVALNQLSVYEKVVLGSAIRLARREGSSAVERTCSMAAVTSEGIRLSQVKKLVEEADIPSIYDLEEACWRLAASRIVIIEANAVPRNSRVIVNVSAEDCLFALRECEIMTALLDSSRDD